MVARPKLGRDFPIGAESGAVHVWLERFSMWARFGVRYLSFHSGIPALVVAALMVVVGWRILKKGAKLALEVAIVAGALLVLTELGVIRW